MAANRKQIASVVWNAIGLLIAAVVLGTLVLWLLPAVLTRHPSSGMTAAEQLKAVNDVRAAGGVPGGGRRGRHPVVHWAHLPAQPGGARHRPLHQGGRPTRRREPGGAHLRNTDLSALLEGRVMLEGATSMWVS